LNLDITRRKLQGWIKLLSARHIATGRQWYSQAHCFAEEVSKAYSLPIEKVVGVLAVLSVQNRWDVNKRDCEAFCRAHHEGLDLEDVSVATYDSQKAKAIAILHADKDTDILSLIGKRTAVKTKAFYDNILIPEKSYSVTIDRWIFRGLGIDLEDKAYQGNSVPPVYRALEELFRLEAIKLKLRPCQLQAAIWCCIQETASREKWEDSRPHSGLKQEEPAPF
jgi:hypothetical protein